MPGSTDLEALGPQAPALPGGRSTWPRVRLPWLAVLVVVAVALGALLGSWQTGVDAQRSARAGTRLLLWDAALQQLDPSAVGAAGFTATGRSLGVPVLVHELRTPYGNVTFSPDVALEPLGDRPLPIRVRPDCSTYPQWQDDFAKAPRTATAMVRDLPRDPLRPVPVELTGDFVVALALVPCAQQAQSSTDVDPPATPQQTIVSVTGMTVSDQGGGIDVRLRITGGVGPGHPVVLALTIGEAYAGPQPATFRLGPAHPTSVVASPGDDVGLTVDLLYHCGPFPTRVPDPGSVVQLTAADSVTGIPVPVTGWTPAVVITAVLGATQAAGCPISS